MTGIGNAAKTLKSINVNKNNIDTELPEELFQLMHLESMYIAFNHIEGTVPTLFGRLTKLTELYAFDNRLSGPIPSELGLLDGCQMLGLGNNLLTGTVPTEINQMVNIHDLSIHHVVNRNAPRKQRGLTGPLPTFGDMPFLTLLFLDGNNFSGTIPTDFLRHNNNIDQPISVGLSSNNLTGTIPKTLERFEALSLDLMGNPIAEIPPELCEKGGWMGGLVEEYKCDAILCAKGSYSIMGRSFSDINLCLPCADDYPFLGATSCDSKTSQDEPWKILAEFYLAMTGGKWTLRDGWQIFDNLVAGDTTDDLENLEIDICDGWYGVLCKDGTLTTLSLPQNELFGTVPDSIFSISSLEVLDLSDNNIQMIDLKGAAKATDLKSLILSNVKLQSLEGIGYMTKLQSLYLDGLNINGTLPDELFRFTALKTLHLQHGHFTGTLPTQIGLLTQLEW
jgi:Leucine-rich repeat (LRR) protein